MDTDKPHSGIKEFRRRKGWKQADLAKTIGMDQTSISFWESGKLPQSFRVVKKFLEIGATVEELFSINYNEMHNLTIKEAAPVSSNDSLTLQVQRIEARLEELKCRLETRLEIRDSE